MSVKNELLEGFVEANWRNPLFSREKCEAWVDQLLAEHAHELAEKIRAENQKRYLGAVGAADLIDPQKEAPNGAVTGQ